jgi:hypothetical protein
LDSKDRQKKPTLNAHERSWLAWGVGVERPRFDLKSSSILTLKAICVNTTLRWDAFQFWGRFEELYCVIAV